MRLTIDDTQKDVKKFVEEIKWKTESSEIFNHLVEEIGEIARALRKKDKENLKEELADTLFLLLKLSNQEDINLSEAFTKKFRSIKEKHQLR